jgi:KTSC domain
MKQKHHAPKPKPKSSKALVLDCSGSECLSEAIWSSKTKTLAVTYTDGSQYLYYDVSRDDALAINDDPGDAINFVIKPNYSYS